MKAPKKKAQAKKVIKDPVGIKGKGGDGKKGKGGASSKGNEAPKKASFGKPGKSAAKKPIVIASPEDLNIPEVLWPSGARGKWSWTVTVKAQESEGSEITLEVNTKGHYYLKKVNEITGFQKHWSWNPHGGPEGCWAALKARVQELQGTAEVEA